jgi:hypothetical protein
MKMRIEYVERLKNIGEDKSSKKCHGVGCKYRCSKKIDKSPRRQKMYQCSYDSKKAVLSKLEDVGFNTHLQ